MYNKDILIEGLKEKVDKFEEVCQENDKNSKILSWLYDKGIIDESGNIIDKNNEENM